MSDLRWTQVTCARCGETSMCTPNNDFYETHLWDGDGVVCERCFSQLVSDHFKK